MKYQSPHEQVCELDTRGEAYWIRLFNWGRGQRRYGEEITLYPSGDFDVAHHGPEWVCLTAKAFDRSQGVTIWKRWEDLGAFQICEEGD